MKVSDYIDELGGAAKVARGLGLAKTTVHSWQRRGAIPEWRIGKLAEYAMHEGKPLPSVLRNGDKQ